MLVLAAKVWHFWMAVAIVGLVVTATLATIAGYLNKVVRPKYPPRSARRP